jgi:hypothetical protein
MTRAGPRGGAATGPVPLSLNFLLRSPRSRLERAAEASPVSTHLDPAEADVLRRALESGYRHARDAAAQAWSTSERSARMRLAAELMTLAFAEQPETTTGAAPAWTGRRCPRHAVAGRQTEPELEAG